MLNFFKKSSQIEAKHSAPTFPANDDNYTSITITNVYSKSANRNLHSPGPLASFDDEGLYDIGDLDTINKERSRLSKTLPEVLADKAALGYFIQFLEVRNGLPYIRCWLDVENFRTAIQHYDEPKQLEVTNNHVKGDHDSLSVSTDCDSLTADSSSLYDFTNNLSDKSKLDLVNSCDRDSDTSPKCNGNYEPNKFIEEFTEDALRIFKKYIALEAPDNIHCPEDTRNQTIEDICNVDKIPLCFKNVQEFVFNLLEKEYFDVFLTSDYFCKFQIDVLTSGCVVLEDILYNETALFYFMEFLEQESNKSLLEFWLAASNFHQQLHDQKEFFDPIEAQNDAVILYDKYFSLQALCPLGFSDKVRFAVEQNICGENGLMHDCFHLPLKIIEQVLDKYFFKPFLASQLFYKYLSELINTVQCSGYCIYDKSSSLASDCGSEKSFSTNSTFLAMENPTKRRDKGADMQIDTRELYDPDALWKRKKHHRLSIGRVTELGKFVKEFEPQPDRKNEFTLKNVMKKLVSLDEDEKKEELAWQVAEMIVKDITSITLNEQKHD